MQAPIELGTILQNRYRVLSILGQGGFGRTYLSEDQSRFNELCAIKELIPPASGAYALEKSKELFQREAQVLYQLQHPQVPQFRATFEQDGRFFIVQDYVDGQTYRMQLDQLRSQGYVFSEAEVQQLLVQLLPTLSYLHGQNIIHRDIAPDNIILRDRDRLPVLIDFGVVKELATRIHVAGSTQQATSVGKVGFAPTEQMQTGRAYPNSDLYALAVTAIVLLTGREPQELIDDKTMTWHWQKWTTVTPNLAHVINRMLSYIPGDRYQSAQDVLQALENPMPAAVVSPVAAPAKMSAPVPTTLVRPPAPPSSQMATVAVARGEADSSLENTSADPANRRPAVSIPPRQSSVWDDPMAVLLVGLSLMFVTGIGAWALFNRFNASNQPEVLPTAIATITPTPTITPIATPTPTNTTSTQSLKLTPATPVNRPGTLKAGETLNLTFDGKTGQTLDAKLVGEGVLMTVLGPDGNVLDDRAKRVASWQGTLPSTGLYVLQMRAIQGLDNGDFKIDASLKEAPVVVVPTPVITPTPTPTPIETPTPTPTPIETPTPPVTPKPEPQIRTEQVLLAPGQTSTTIAGKASAQTLRRYLINAKAGQVLTVDVRGGANMTLMYPDGRPIEDTNGIQRWSGQLPDAGDYMVDVSAAQPSDFELNVTVK
jgi:serine/threonine protein kinase